MDIKRIRVGGLFTFDRYLGMTFLKHFLVSLLFFLGIYLFSVVLTELPALLKRANYNPYVTMGNVMKNYYHKIPGFLSTVFPFAYLFSTSYILGNFYKNNEIVSIISAGWTIRRITVAIIIFGVLFSFIMMFLNFNWIPRANYLGSQIQEKLYREVKQKDVNNMQTYGEGGIFYFARYYSSRSRKFISFLILKQRNDKELEVQADEIVDFNQFASMDVKSQIEKLSGTNFDLSVYFPYESAIRGEKLEWNDKQKKWIATKGVVWKWDEKGKLLNSEVFDKRVLDLAERPNYFSKETRDIKEMTLNEVFQYLDKLKKSRQPFKKELVEYYSEKYAKPFSIFILALLASSLGRFFSRKHLLVMTLISSFVIGFCYFILISIGVSLGKEGILPPFFAAFLGNFLSIGIYYYLRKKQLT